MHLRNIGLRKPLWVGHFQAVQGALGLGELYVDSVYGDGGLGDMGAHGLDRRFYQSVQVAQTEQYGNHEDNEQCQKHTSNNFYRFRWSHSLPDEALTHDVFFFL